MTIPSPEWRRPVEVAPLPEEDNSLLASALADADGPVTVLLWVDGARAEIWFPARRRSAFAKLWRVFERWQARTSKSWTPRG